MANSVIPYVRPRLREKPKVLVINSLTHMPILGSSNSAANKNI